MALRLSDIIGSSSVDKPFLLDNIGSGFNGVTTQFTLSTNNGETFGSNELTDEARLIVSVGGILQKPDPSQGAGFYLSGGSDRVTDPVKINFVEAPAAGLQFFGTVIKNTGTTLAGGGSDANSIAYAVVFGS